MSDSESSRDRRLGAISEWLSRADALIKTPREDLSRDAVVRELRELDARSRSAFRPTAKGSS